MWKTNNFNGEKIWYSKEEYKDLIKHIEQQQKCINELEWLNKKLMKELEEKCSKNI